MKTEDFYTGEPIDNNRSSPFERKDENEAAAMASFGKYDYDPGLRQNQIYPGGTGYNVYPQYGYGTYPQVGLGAMPNPVFNPVQPTYGMYRNPYPVYYPQQQSLPETVHIPGINLSGEYLPNEDFDERIEKLKMDYIAKKEEIDAKNTVDQSSSYGYGNGFGWNYYGASYYNPYQYNSLNQFVSKEIDAMKNEARENRMVFNLNMSKLAHKFADDDISTEDIEERYRGRTIKTPTSCVIPYNELYQINRLSNMVPVDNSQQYRDYELAVQAEYNKIIPKDADLKTAFENMGVMWANWELEEELHRRRDGSKLYNSDNDAYKYFIRKKAEERYRREKGLPVANQQYDQFSNFNPQQLRQDFINKSPLSQVATLADDGELKVSLSLPYNVGSMKGQNYTVNSNEKEYEEKRARFASFLNSVKTDDNIHLDELKQKKLDNFRG